MARKPAASAPRKSRAAPKVSATAKKNGRPLKLTADQKTLDGLRGLGKIQCTNRECAAFLNVAENTFLKFIRDHPEANEAFEQGKAVGFISLRRLQFRAAEKGNSTMLVWLGKQWLGQSDKIKHVGGDESDNPIRLDLSGLDEKELETLERIRAKIAVASGDQSGT